MTKLVVVEARRLLPIAVLFIMLVAVSIYDGLTTPAATVTTQPNTVPYRTLAEAAQSAEMQAKIITDLEMWVAMHQALGIPLTDHQFEPDQEIAVVLLNCQLRSTRDGDGIVELDVAPRKSTFQLVLFSKEHLDYQENVRFVLKEHGKDN